MTSTDSDRDRQHGPVAPRRHDRYEVWAPSAAAVQIRIDGTEHTMEAGEDGWHRLPEVPAAPGSRYAFRLDGEGPWVPDPRSLSQPEGVHADSEVIDPALLRGTTEWTGRSVQIGRAHV